MWPMATLVKGDPGDGSERPTGRDQILDAVLDAADELMSARGPEVSLRAIAEHAGVSYSLVHRHVGTKDALVDRLLQRYAERWSATLAADPSYARALGRLLDQPGAGAGSYLRLLAWTLLGGEHSDSPAAEAHRRNAHLLPVATLRQHTLGPDGHPSLADRLDLALALSLIFGWRFFQPFIVDVLDLADSSPAELHQAVAAELRRIADRPTAPDAH